MTAYNCLLLKKNLNLGFIQGKKISVPIFKQLFLLQAIGKLLTTTNG